MHTKRLCLPIVLGLATSLVLLTAAHADPAIEASVVKVNATRQVPDYFRPWTKGSPDEISGSGVVIDGNRILTNAHVVTFASKVLIQLRQGGDQLSAKVTALAPAMDLAIVELKNPAGLDGVAPVSLATEPPKLKSSVSVYGYPTGGDDLSVTNGIVSRIEYAEYYFDAGGLRIQVDAALNPGNSGGPAIQDGRIAGLVFSKIQEAENIGYLIPPEEIEAFLSDIEDGYYAGNMLLFDQFQTAENGALQGYVNASDGVTGLVVSAPYRRDDDYPLHSWDVLTKVGPHNIDNQGYVKVPEGRRLRFQYYVPKLQSDGMVEVTIWRDGESQVVHVPVRAERELLVPYLKEQYPEYFIYGPLVFTAASQEFLRDLGSRWRYYLATIHSPMLKRQFDLCAEEGEQLVVVATEMFPHPITKGYGNTTCAVVERLNGVKVKNLRHLAESLRNCRDDFIRFEMAGRSESLIFRRSEAEAATEEVLNDEGIRYQASKGLRDVWKKE